MKPRLTMSAEEEARWAEDVSYGLIHQSQSKAIRHGTLTAYRHDRCRCRECCASNTAYARSHYKYNPATKSAQNKRYWAKHRDELIAKRRARRQAKKAGRVS